MPWIKEDQCRGCAKCVSVCPEGAIVMNNGVATILQNKCTRCGKCLSACPFDLIRPNSENPSLKGMSMGGRGTGGGTGRGMGRGMGGGTGRGMGRR